MHSWLTVAMALTSHQILRVIFRQPDLKRASGRKGQLKAVTLYPNAAPVGYLVVDPTFLIHGSIVGLRDIP